MHSQIKNFISNKDVNILSKVIFFDRQQPIFFVIYRDRQLISHNFRENSETVLHMRKESFATHLLQIIVLIYIVDISSGNPPLSFPATSSDVINRKISSFKIRLSDYSSRQLEFAGFAVFGELCLE